MLLGGILVGATRWTIWDCVTENAWTESETKAVWDWFELPRVRDALKMAWFAAMAIFLSWTILCIAAWSFKIVPGWDGISGMNSIWFLMLPVQSLTGLKESFRTEPPSPAPPKSFPGTAHGLHSNHWGYPAKEVR